MPEEIEQTAPLAENTLQSMSAIVAGQRQFISATLSSALAKCADNIVELLNQRDALERKLQDLQQKLDHYKYLYVLDANGVQITANLSQNKHDDSQLGRDRSRRPYMQGMFGDTNFQLSDGYISRHRKRPSLTAVQVIRDSQQRRLGFLCVDYDLRSLPRQGAVFQGSREWRQMKGDPSIRGGLFTQQRTHSLMDEQLDNVLALMEELMLEHGVFHGKLHFSSSRATIWHIDDPYCYHLLSIEDLTDPDICLAYPLGDYPERAIVPVRFIGKIFDLFRQLRYADDNIYLRAGSLNLINGMVGLNFSCDGSHYLRYDEFLQKDMSFWFGL